MTECYVVRRHRTGMVDSVYLSKDNALLRRETMLTIYCDQEIDIIESKIYDLEDLRDDVC